MKKLLVLFFLIGNFVAYPQASSPVYIKLYPEKANRIINKEIYGQFAEHLGACVYGGLWVGKKSKIPNINGYRKDVFEALKRLQVPVMRWPGGCFADTYHWMDGIGPQEKRPKMINTNWGGTVEDNSFGTDEFLNLCEMLGCEPYISGNVGSGSVQELSDWVEYMTSDADSPMANLRRKNGRHKPWKVKYLGVGNESWGCGGNMRPEYYSDLYRRYSTFCHDYSGNVLFKIASGAGDYNTNWTDVLMKNIGNRMNGISLHYYTIKNWNDKGSATQFGPDDYYQTISKCMEMEDVLKKHISIMDTYDKDKKIALMVDEWGTWFNVEPGTNPGFLFQQNTMRDALVAALTLNIFNKYTDRIKMTNIAQVVNVLQAMILTQNDKMLLTPTYYVYDMYKVHQDAVYIPLQCVSDTKAEKNEEIPYVTASASKKDGAVHVTLTNIDLSSKRKVTIDLSGIKAENLSGTVLTSSDIADHNTFENPNQVKEQKFEDMQLEGGNLVLNLPAKSIVELEIK